MKRYQIKEALTQYLAEINLPISTLESFCGFSDRYLYKMDFCLPEKKIDAIVSVLPNLSKDYLMTGNGPSRTGTEDIVMGQNLSAKGIDDAAFRENVMSRLEEILRLEGFATSRDYEKHLRTFRGIWENAKKQGDKKVIYEWVNCVLEEFPSYSYDWVLFGSGAMKRQEDLVLPLYSAPEDFLSSEKGKDFYSVPFLKDADLLYKLADDSIDKTIRRGDIIAAKTISVDEIRNANLSKQFLIVPGDNYPIVARIRVENDHISVIDTLGYEVLLRNKKDIKYIGQIVGYISLQ